MPRASKPNGRADLQKRARDSAKENGEAANFGDSEAIARRAYEIYQNRGAYDGADLDDWLEAERQLKTSPSDVTGPVPAKPRKRKAAEPSGL